MNCLLMIFMFVLSGCTTVVTERPALGPGPVDEGSKPLTNIAQIKPGMSVSEAKAVMGERVVIGYQIKEGTKEYQPLVIKNPAKAEMFIADGKTYQVLYHFTQVKKSDGLISDDELTPLTFDSDKLIGLDWDTLFKLRGQPK